jgi:class 3 adenylate cyclase
MRAEFTSPLSAVCCAVEIQEALTRPMAGVPSPARIRLRIGIHYGEAVKGSDAGRLSLTAALAAAAIWLALTEGRPGP